MVSTGLLSLSSTPTSTSKARLTIGAPRELDLSPFEAEIILYAMEPEATEYDDTAV